MLNLPEIKRKQREASYKKPDAVKELERMADAEAKRLHPTCPHLAPRTFRDDSANNLTGCITTYLRLKGAFSSRLNNTGIFDKRLNRYRPTTSRKGLPDILATYQGKSLFIEVKAGRDRMSIDQVKVMKEQTGSGGLYFVASDFTQFKEWFDNI
ncbi:MAG: hypothetical protein WCS03_09435 [Bacteroidota bacterium]